MTVDRIKLPQRGTDVKTRRPRRAVFGYNHSRMRKATLHILLLFAAAVQAAEPPAVFTVARLHYGGGGDWYSDPSSLPNLLKFLPDSTGLEGASDEAVGEP